MADTMRAVRSQVKRRHVKCGGFSMPHTRYYPRSWYPVAPRGFHSVPRGWKARRRRG